MGQTRRVCPMRYKNDIDKEEVPSLYLIALWLKPTKSKKKLKQGLPWQGISQGVKEACFLFSRDSVGASYRRRMSFPDSSTGISSYLIWVGRRKNFHI